jgi:hypothetical protein
MAIGASYAARGSNTATLGRCWRMRDRCRILRKNTMTPDQSKQLKTGTRVCFNGDQADLGTVIATETRYVTIKWDDGHKSFSGHREMKRVELVRK